MTHSSLLIEIGTEELPPKALPALANSFYDGIIAGLEARSLNSTTKDDRLRGVLYSPRRLAVYLPFVLLQQHTVFSEVLGPYVNVGLTPDGQPTPALIGFAKKNGVSIEQLVRVNIDAKGERFVARSERAGSLTVDLLPEIVAEALKALPIPKPMRWGDRSESFVRPAHWLLALFGSAVVPMAVLGLKAGRTSRGHRFHSPGAFDVANPESYVDALRAHHVLVDPDERQTRIAAQIGAAAKAAGKQAEIPEGLLAEVNCLVEWPAAVSCRFDAGFLRVPHEALVSTMQANQKFFALREADGTLSDCFVGIANIDSKDPARIRQGYERVIRPRFADAAFFFDEDLKQGIDAMAQGLASVTYQQKLGSYADKTARVATLAEAIAVQAGLDAAEARRAAELSKADLQSRLVGEFPELQGIAGRYYAKAAGQSDAVAQAIDEAYRPRFAGDAIAASKLGQVLAIAERLDTLAGGFAAGLKPTGNKDPFALRRNALGLARTLIEGGFDLSLDALLAKAAAAQPVQSVEAGVEPLRDFIIDRLRGYYADQDVPQAQFDAVAGLRPASLRDFDRRLGAIAGFVKLPEAAALAAANKRIGNILKKSGSEAAAAVDPLLFQETAERGLWAALTQLETQAAPKLAAGEYTAMLHDLAALREPVDTFFDAVMVNADDPKVRGNRLAMLRRLALQFNAVGDIAVLA